jgi:hypothetical protein
MTDEELAQEWMEAKQVEKSAVESRRQIEDRLLSLIGIPETLEGTQSAEAGAYKIKVTGRMSRKVDTDKLQEVALANGIFDHLQSLFRWKAEINAAQWKIADASITEPLTEAITTKPGRPAFQITREGE